MGTQIRLRAVAQGLLSYVAPPALYTRAGGSSQSARYCYSVYLRHLVKLAEVGACTKPKAIAEIGPGNSIGVGLAALIAGTERYFGFDAKAHANDERNVAICGDLIKLFQQRAPIPDNDEFPRVRPALGRYDFPNTILDEERLAAALDNTRLAKLLVDITPGVKTSPESMVTYVAPWDDPSILREESIDWILSQSVMEHVDDLAGAYRTCFAWLKSGACMSHQIDFKCHNTAKSWNGHWGLSDLAWRVTRGARPFLLNREPHSTHTDLIQHSRFDILLNETVLRDDGIGRSRLAARFAGLSDADLRTSDAFLIAAKP